jgi:hypothetical protein
LEKRSLSSLRKNYGNSWLMRKMRPWEFHESYWKTRRKNSRKPNNSSSRGIRKEDLDKDLARIEITFANEFLGQ